MLRITLAKLLRYPSFWRFFLLFTLSIPLSFYAGAYFVDFALSDSALPIRLWFQRPHAWATVATLARWLLFAPAFLIVQIICSEIELRLVRAQVAAGLERHEIVIGWILINTLQILAGSLISLGTVALLARMNEDGLDSSSIQIWAPQLGFLIYGFSFLNFAILAALTLRRPAPALALLILWPLLIEPFIGWQLGHQGYASLKKYLPFEALAAAVAAPLGELSWASLAMPMSLSLAWGLAAGLGAWAYLRRINL